MSLLSTNFRRLKDFVAWVGLFHQRDDFRIVENKNRKEKIAEDVFYKEMHERYDSVINAGIEPEDASKPCNKIWMCWLQGENQAPPLVKCCVNSIRRNMPDKELIILTEETIPQYVHLPVYIWEKRKRGMISNAHFSDLLRVSLLCEWGGIWCDATLLCTSTPPQFMTDAPMFVFKSMDLQRSDIEPTLCSSWYISAWSNQRILLLTRNLLYEYWKTFDSIGNYFAFHIFLAMAARRYPEEWAAIPFYNNHSPHTLQFELADTYTNERWKQITDISCIHKLNHHNKYALGENNFYEHILNEYGG